MKTEKKKPAAVISQSLLFLKFDVAIDRFTFVTVTTERSSLRRLAVAVAAFLSFFLSVVLSRSEAL